MIHIDNLDYILNLGLITSPNHERNDKDYIPIGDNTLISKRKGKKIEIKPYGNFEDYVSFYFSKKTPMLYTIQHGYNNVIKQDSENIIYLVAEYHELINKTQFVFTDGHAYDHFTQYFNNKLDLINLDFEAIKSKYWHNNQDPDLKRRKQAEFLVLNELSFSNIIGIIVSNEKTKIKVEEKLSKYKYICKVDVQPKAYFDV